MWKLAVSITLFLTAAGLWPVNAKIGIQRQQLKVEEDVNEVIPGFISATIIGAMKKDGLFSDGMDGLFPDMYEDGEYTRPDERSRGREIHMSTDTEEVNHIKESPLKAIDMVKVVPDIFNRPLPEFEFKDAMTMTSFCSSAKKHGKSIRLPATVIRKVKALEDILPLSDPTGHDMITTVITRTTSMHRDFSRDINGKRQLVTTPTSIIFMNNNPDAYLNLDEEGMSIPIIKGSLVKFDGSKLHHTIINDGIVQLVGPFEGNRLSPVGTCGTYGNGCKNGCCEEGTICQNSRRLEGSIEGHDVERKLQLPICVCDGVLNLGDSCVDFGDGAFPGRISCCETGPVKTTGLFCDTSTRRLDRNPNPIVRPTGICVAAPTKSPTNAPTTFEPTVGPTNNPTKNPTDIPTDTPTMNPTEFPTKNPTLAPTDTPTMNPTKFPTKNPTDAPTATPTKNPTEVPSDAPSESSAPSVSAVPSQVPSETNSPSMSVNPSQAPSVSINPTQTENPTQIPSMSPSLSTSPSLRQSQGPSVSINPTQIPTASPVTPSPTDTPTMKPSDAPTDTPTKKPSTKSPVTDKPTVDKKELLLLLLLLKLAFHDYLHDLIWKSSTTTVWSGDSWDKPMTGPDTLPSSPSGKAGKMSKAKGLKTGKGGKGTTKASPAVPGLGMGLADAATLGKGPVAIEKNSASDNSDEGAILIAQLLAMLNSMGVGGDLHRRSLEAVDVNGIKAKFIKRIQTSFNGRRDLEMMLGAGVGMMGAFQETLNDNMHLFESEDMEAVEAKLESMLNE